MQEPSPILLPHRKICLAVFAVSCLILILFYYDNTLLSYGLLYPTDEIAYYEATKNNSNSTPTAWITIPVRVPDDTTSPPTKNKLSQDINFIVSSSKCKIVDVKPFNKDAKKFHHPEKYTPCRSKELLTYVTKDDNIATLHIAGNLVPSYAKNGISCCYSTITRKKNSKDPDGAITISSCKLFENNVTINSDPVLVKCSELSKPHHQVYENVHVATVIKDEVQNKINNIDNTTKPLSVLFIGIDSISRLNFIRSLPNTHKFVEENGWVSLKGYNKVDDNTFPNLMAILTGYNQSQSYSVCDPKVIGKLDKCPLLWFDFRRLGFVTAYAEDEGPINTFNYRKKGFQFEPADYYLRPYVLATEKLAKKHKDGMTYCTGPETAGERIMNVAKDFAITFKDYPNFGFFWMNSFSHNKINSPTGMDNKVKDFLVNLTVNGVTDNSIVIFLSDHGMRFGDIRLTDTGWLEERLPFIYVSFPKWFQQNYSKEFENFKNNSQKLTTPYDLHMTLKHILVLSGHNYTMLPSDACPKCKSLFEEIDSERSCEEAGIAQHWCTCAGYSSTALDEETERKVSNFLLKQIHEIMQSRNSDHRCAKYSIEKNLDFKISQKFPYRKESFLLFKLRTYPKAEFETTISFVGDLKTSNLTLSGDISRLDSYNEHSKCVSDAYLKKYCYCRSTGIRV